MDCDFVITPASYGPGQGQNVDSRGAVFEQRFGAFVGRGAGCVNVIDEQDSPFFNERFFVDPESFFDILQSVLAAQTGLGCRRSDARNDILGDDNRRRQSRKW